MCNLYCFLDDSNFVHEKGNLDEVIQSEISVKETRTNCYKDEIFKLAENHETSLLETNNFQSRKLLVSYFIRTTTRVITNRNRLDTARVLINRHNSDIIHFTL